MNKTTLLFFFTAFATQVFGQFGSRNIIENSNIGITEIITADINNDSLEDIIISQKYSYDVVSYYLNLGNGSFDSSQTMKANLNDPRTVTAGDYNNDGWVDFASASTSFGNNTDTLFIFKNQLGNFFVPIVVDTQTTVFEKIVKLKTEDIDNDNDLDIIAISDMSLMIY